MNLGSMKVQGVSRKGEDMKCKDVVIEVGIMLEKNVKEILKESLQKGVLKSGKYHKNKKTKEGID